MHCMMIKENYVKNHWFVASLILLLIVWSLAPVHATERTVPKDKSQLYLSFSPIVKKTAPAVVNIYTQKKVKVRSFSPFLNDPFFQEFFGNSL